MPFFFILGSIFRYSGFLTSISRKLSTLDEKFERICSETGKAKKLKVLISRPDFNKDKLRLRNPLHFLCQNNFHECLTILLQLGFDGTFSPGGVSPLHIACENGSLECVKMMVLTYPSTINARRKDSLTPLLIASHFGHLAVVEFLVISGCDIKICSVAFDNALHTAVCRNHHEIVSQKNNNNQTPYNLVHDPVMEQIIMLSLFSQSFSKTIDTPTDRPSETSSLTHSQNPQPQETDKMKRKSSDKTQHQEEKKEKSICVGDWLLYVYQVECKHGTKIRDAGYLGGVVGVGLGLEAQSSGAAPTIHSNNESIELSLGQRFVGRGWSSYIPAHGARYISILGIETLDKEEEESRRSLDTHSKTSECTSTHSRPDERSKPVSFQPASGYVMLNRGDEKISSLICPFVGPDPWANPIPTPNPASQPQILPLKLLQGLEELSECICTLQVPLSLSRASDIPVGKMADSLSRLGEDKNSRREGMEWVGQGADPFEQESRQIDENRLKVSEAQLTDKVRSTLKILSLAKQEDKKDRMSHPSIQLLNILLACLSSSSLVNVPIVPFESCLSLPPPLVSLSIQIRYNCMLILQSLCQSEPVQVSLLSPSASSLVSPSSSSDSSPEWMSGNLIDCIVSYLSWVGGDINLESQSANQNHQHQTSGVGRFSLAATKRINVFMNRMAVLASSILLSLASPLSNRPILLNWKQIKLNGIVEVLLFAIYHDSHQTRQEIDFLDASEDISMPVIGEMNMKKSNDTRDQNNQDSKNEKTDIDQRGTNDESIWTWMGNDFYGGVGGRVTNNALMILSLFSLDESRREDLALFGKDQKVEVESNQNEIKGIVTDMAREMRKKNEDRSFDLISILILTAWAGEGEGKKERGKHTSQASDRLLETNIPRGSNQELSLGILIRISPYIPSYIIHGSPHLQSKSDRPNISMLSLFSHLLDRERSNYKVLELVLLLVGNLARRSEIRPLLLLDPGLPGSPLLEILTMMLICSLDLLEANSISNLKRNDSTFNCCFNICAVLKNVTDCPINKLRTSAHPLLLPTLLRVVNLYHHQIKPVFKLCEAACGVIFNMCAFSGNVPLVSLPSSLPSYAEQLSSHSFKPSFMEFKATMMSGRPGNPKPELTHILNRWDVESVFKTIGIDLKSIWNFSETLKAHDDDGGLLDSYLKASSSSFLSTDPDDESSMAFNQFHSLQSDTYSSDSSTSNQRSLVQQNIESESISSLSISPKSISMPILLDRLENLCLVPLLFFPSSSPLPIMSSSEFRSWFLPLQNDLGTQYLWRHMKKMILSHNSKVEIASPEELGLCLSFLSRLALHCHRTYLSVIPELVSSIVQVVIALSNLQISHHRFESTGKIILLTCGSLYYLSHEIGPASLMNIPSFCSILETLGSSPQLGQQTARFAGLILNNLMTHGDLPLEPTTSLNSDRVDASIAATASHVPDGNSLDKIPAPTISVAPSFSANLTLSSPVAQEPLTSELIALKSSVSSLQVEIQSLQSVLSSFVECMTTKSSKGEEVEERKADFQYDHEYNYQDQIVFSDCNPLFSIPSFTLSSEFDSNKCSESLNEKTTSFESTNSESPNGLSEFLNGQTDSSEFLNGKTAISEFLTGKSAISEPLNGKTDSSELLKHKIERSIFLDKRTNSESPNGLYEFLNDQTSRSELLIDKNASSQLLTGKTASSELLTDKTASSELLTGKTANSELLLNGKTDKTASSELLTGKTSSSELLLTDKTASSELLTGKTSSSELLLTDTTASSELLNDKTASSELLTDKTASSELLTDKTASSELLTDKTASSELLTNKTASSELLLTDKTASSLNDKTASSEFLTDKTASSELLTDKTASSQLLTDKTSSSELLTDKTASSELLTDKTASSELLTDKTASSELLTDKTASSEFLTNKTASSELLTDKTASSELLTDKTASSNLLTDKTASSELLNDKTASSEFLTDKTASSELLTDKTASSELLTDKTASSELLNDKTASSELLTDTTASSELLTDKTASSELLTDKTASSELVNDKTASSELLTDKTASSEFLTDKTASSELLNDKTSSSELLNDKTASSELLNDKTASSELLTDKTASSELLNDKTASSELLNDKTASSELLTDKTASSEFLTDKTSSSELLTDKTASSELLTDKTASSESLIDKTASSELLTDKTASSELLTDKTASSELLTDKTASSELLTDKTASSELLTDKTASSELLTDKTASSELLIDKTASSESLTDKTASSELLTDKTSSSELLTDKTASSELLTDTTASSESLIDKTASSELLNDKNTSSELLTDKTASSELLTDKTASSELLTDKTASSESLSTESLNDKFINYEPIISKSTNDESSESFNKKVMSSVSSNESASSESFNYKRAISDSLNDYIESLIVTPPTTPRENASHPMNPAHSLSLFFFRLERSFIIPLSFASLMNQNSFSTPNPSSPSSSSSYSSCLSLKQLRQFWLRKAFSRLRHFEINYPSLGALPSFVKPMFADNELTLGALYCMYCDPSIYSKAPTHQSKTSIFSRFLRDLSSSFESKNNLNSNFSSSQPLAPALTFNPLPSRKALGNYLWSDDESDAGSRYSSQSSLYGSTSGYSLNSSSTSGFKKKQFRTKLQSVRLLSWTALQSLLRDCHLSPQICSEEDLIQLVQKILRESSEDEIDIKNQRDKAKKDTDSHGRIGAGSRQVTMGDEDEEHTEVVIKERKRRAFLKGDPRLSEQKKKEIIELERSKHQKKNTDSKSVNDATELVPPVPLPTASKSRHRSRIPQPNPKKTTESKSASSLSSIRPPDNTLKEIQLTPSIQSTLSPSKMLNRQSFIPGPARIRSPSSPSPSLSSPSCFSLSPSNSQVPSFARPKVSHRDRSFHAPRQSFSSRIESFGGSHDQHGAAHVNSMVRARVETIEHKDNTISDIDESSDSDSNSDSGHNFDPSNLFVSYQGFLKILWEIGWAHLPLPASTGPVRRLETLFLRIDRSGVIRKANIRRGATRKGLPQLVCKNSLIGKGIQALLQGESLHKTTISQILRKLRLTQSQKSK